MVRKPDCQNIPVHNGSKFTWTEKLGVIEASDFGKVKYTGRIWQDACDAGFYVRSHKTGVMKLFTYAGAIVPNGGSFPADCLGYAYTSEDGFRVDVLND